MNATQDERVSSLPPRAGYVTLLGRPNSGKSTLLNALVGERLSIVTSRPQTTWWRVTGIRTDDRSQMIFLDTPGIIEAGSLIHRALMEEAKRALADADVLLLVMDPASPLDARGRAELAELANSARAPVIGVINKIDAAGTAAIEAESAWLRTVIAEEPLRISALKGTGMEELLESITERLPEGPFLFPEDDIATAPVRFFVEEMVRETVFEQFHEEIPYAVFCRVEEFREGGDRTYIQVNVFVERSSQKAILLGRGGEAIRELGRVSRKKIEHFLDAPVYLDLWIKILPRWRKKRGQLRRLGLPVPENDAKNR